MAMLYNVSRFCLDATRPGLTECFAKGTNSVALDLFGQLLQHIDFSASRFALLESLHDLFRPGFN